MPLRFNNRDGPHRCSLPAKIAEFMYAMAHKWHLRMISAAMGTRMHAHPAWASSQTSRNLSMQLPRWYMVLAFVAALVGYAFFVPRKPSKILKQAPSPKASELSEYKGPGTALQLLDRARFQSRLRSVE